MTTKETQYYNSVRQSVKKLVEVLNELSVHQGVWNAEVYGDNLPDSDDITKNELGAVVFATYDAIQSTLNAGGGGLKGNLFKVL